jgi:hypothetical protein
MIAKNDYAMKSVKRWADAEEEIAIVNHLR